jgi:N-formylmaleamate deformylase
LRPAPRRCSIPAGPDGREDAITGSKWLEREHDSGGARIHYWRTGGEGKPPLVLVHGFSDSGPCWGPVARELEDEFDVVMPDMVGHGLSSRAAEAARIDMAEDLASLIRSLRLDRPVVIGHSMGAMVSSQAVARYPDLARALVLEDPPWFTPASLPAEPGGGDPPIVAWAKTLRSAGMDELLSGYRRDHPDWPDELVRAMCEAKKRLDQGIIDELGRSLQAERSSWESVLASIRCPLLLIAGDPSLGAIVGPEALERVRAIKPEAEIAPVPGVGHLIRFDAPDAFMRALGPFLAKQAGSGRGGTAR